MLICSSPPPRRRTRNHSISKYSFYPFQGEKLAKVIKASGNEVEGFWPAMFAKALKGQNIEELLSNIGSAVAAGPVLAAGPSDAPVKKEASKFTSC